GAGAGVGGAAGGGVRRPGLPDAGTADQLLRLLPGQRRRLRRRTRTLTTATRRDCAGGPGPSWRSEEDQPRKGTKITGGVARGPAPRGGAGRGPAGGASCPPSCVFCAFWWPVFGGHSPPAGVRARGAADTE